MNGCGNDYVYFDLTSHEAAAKGGEIIAAVPAISDRHFGVGGDGVVLILPSGVADVRMRMFNADGSEGKMCGNAIRCVGKYAYEAGLTEGRTSMTVETASGVKKLSLIVEDGMCAGASVDMGRAVFEAKDIPLDESFLPDGYLPADTPFGRVWSGVPVSAYGQTWTGTAVSMGNPHFVIFTDENVEALDEVQDAGVGEGQRRDHGLRHGELRGGGGCRRVRHFARGRGGGSRPERRHALRCLHRGRSHHDGECGKKL